MIGIGNEQWGPQYVERYQRFAAAQHGLYASASLDGRTNDIVVKVVNSEAVAKPVRLAIEGAATRGDARIVTLASTDLQAENSIDQPARVAPVDSRVTLGEGDLRLELQPQSVTVVRLPKGK
jgi:alpha-L-arabinofuranosidase